MTSLQPKPRPKPKPAPADLADLLRRASSHHQRGELHEAEALYRQILDLQSDHFDALHLLGVLSFQRGAPAEALTLIGRALASDARSGPAHCNRGLVLAALARHDEALASYERAIALKPDHAEAFNNRGNALRALRRNEEALVSFERALALRPDYALALNNRGNVLYTLGRFDAALTSFERVLAIHPHLPEMLNNRGNALWALRRPAEALASYDAALARDPGNAQIHNNRGNALLDLNRPDEALASFDAALARHPDYAEALVNRGNALRDLDRDDEAKASIERALAIEPELAEAHWNKALLSLSHGDYQAGWRDYEWRWRRAGAVPRDFAQPQWRGEDIAGKTILLHAEQGFGDTLQFLRYLPMVAERGAKMILEAPDSLIPLLAPLDGVVAVVSRDSAPLSFDLHCPLLSLAAAFGTTLASVPPLAPVLRVPAARVTKWRARLPRGGVPSVGIVWSGKPSHSNDHNRSIALTRLSPLLATPGVTFVSLQREIRAADASELAKIPALLRLEDELDDFADTAAVIGELDLVIAVDTAVAHLAASLGKPVWVLLPRVPDWRWLLDRQDCPWYPSARLFRQPALGDWDSVIAQVAQALATVAKTPPRA